MILAVMAVALCLDYWALGTEILRHKGKPPEIIITKDERALLTRAATQKALELGYDLRRLDFELYQKDDSYIGYFRPVDKGQLGGDLIIVLDAGGNALCFFRGQ